MKLPESSTLTGALLASTGSANVAVNPPASWPELVLQLIPILIGIYDLVRRERTVRPH